MTGTARSDRSGRPAAGWKLLAEMPLTVDCPAWCVEDASATGDGGPVCLCLYHAAQAVENGDVDPADLTVAPAPERDETAVGAR